MKYLLILITLVCSCTVFAADTISFDQLADLTITDSSSISQTASQMITDAGSEDGFLAGKAMEAKRIRGLLTDYAPLLDQLYDFNLLINTKNGLLPPVIVEANNVAHITDKEIRTGNTVYDIIKPERFVSNPPTWREYLYAGLMPSQQHFTPIEIKGSDQKTLWINALKTGWEQGIKEADQILEINFNRLTRDYTGMMTYITLRHENMVTAPKVGVSVKTVTGSDNRLIIGDKDKTLQSNSTFNLNDKQWEPNINYE